jgi:hypothetical protein
MMNNNNNSQQNNLLQPSRPEASALMEVTHEGSLFFRVSEAAS